MQDDLTHLWYTYRETNQEYGKYQLVINPNYSAKSGWGKGGGYDERESD